MNKLLLSIPFVGTALRIAAATFRLPRILAVIHKQLHHLQNQSDKLHSEVSSLVANNTFMTTVLHQISAAKKQNDSTDYRLFLLEQSQQTISTTWRAAQTNGKLL